MAEFSTDPQKQLNISVPLPQAVQPKPPAQGSAVQVGQQPAPAKTQQAKEIPFEQSPVRSSTILPYYQDQEM